MSESVLVEMRDRGLHQNSQETISLHPTPSDYCRSSIEGREEDRQSRSDSQQRFIRWPIASEGMTSNEDDDGASSSTADRPEDDPSASTGLKTFRLFLGLSACWLTEIVASIISVASFFCMIVILQIYDGKIATDTHPPNYLTMNGMIAAISTINRACLTMPVCSAIMQEMWVYFVTSSKKGFCLEDAELFAGASRGAWGSLNFLFHARGAK